MPKPDTYSGNDLRIQADSFPTIDDKFEIWILDTRKHSFPILYVDLPADVRRLLDAGEHRGAADALADRLRLQVTIQYTRKLTVRPRLNDGSPVLPGSAK